MNSNLIVLIVALISSDFIEISTIAMHCNDVVISVKFFGCKESDFMLEYLESILSSPNGVFVQTSDFLQS